jgi:hypothetical protein
MISMPTISPNCPELLCESMSTEAHCMLGLLIFCVQICLWLGWTSPFLASKTLSRVRKIAAQDVSIDRRHYETKSTCDITATFSTSKCNRGFDMESQNYFFNRKKKLRAKMSKTHTIDCLRGWWMLLDILSSLRPSSKQTPLTGPSFPNYKTPK